jgi:histidinol dehydrogenase
MIKPLETVVSSARRTAPLPSSLLMTAIPARIAGVKDIILATPPQASGSVSPVTLAAARLAGISRVFAIGGAQAIAAMAYGTASVPRVDKVCGPGNMYVTLAKKMVNGDVGIDGLFGPSEVLIIADESADPAYIAATSSPRPSTAPGLGYPAHGPRRLADDVNRQVTEQLKDAPAPGHRAGFPGEARPIILVDNIDEALELSNSLRAGASLPWR